MTTTFRNALTHDKLTAISKLFLPPPALTSCVAVGIFRDTRTAQLSEFERLNYFPASPLFTVTHILHGEILVSKTLCRLEDLRDGSAMQDLDVSGPQPSPMVSWSPGPVAAFSIGFFPDAWLRLNGGGTDESLPSCLESAITRLSEHEQPEEAWNAFCDALMPVWATYRNTSEQSRAANLTDWMRHILARIATSNSGKSVRSMERRLRTWTGHNRQTLAFYSKMEELHSLRVKNPEATPAELAFDAEFADQSHMGRFVRRATGFSPAALNALVDNDEAFWCYRLMGERF